MTSAASFSASSDGVPAGAIKANQTTIQVAGETYTLNIQNMSGESATVFIFQKKPTATNIDWKSLVWQQHDIGDEQIGTFTWSLDWQLSFAETPVELSDGVKYSATSIPGHIAPNPKYINSMYVNKDPNKTNFNALYAKTPEVPVGKFAAILGSYDQTTLDGQHLTIGVHVGSRPVFATPAGPGKHYVFTVKPTYWIAIGDSAVSTVLDMDTLTNPTQVQFLDEQDVTYELSTSNQFTKKFST